MNPKDKWKGTCKSH